MVATQYRLMPNLVDLWTKTARSRATCYCGDLSRRVDPVIIRLAVCLYGVGGGVRCGEAGQSVGGLAQFAVAGGHLLARFATATGGASALTIGLRCGFYIDCCFASVWRRGRAGRVYFQDGCSGLQCCGRGLICGSRIYPGQFHCRLSELFDFNGFVFVQPWSLFSFSLPRSRSCGKVFAPIGNYL